VARRPRSCQDAGMRAMVLTGFGGPEQLQLQEVPTPEPGPGDVLVAVAAAAVNNTDLNTRLGWYGAGGWSGTATTPRIQGADVCGRVTAVGAGVPAGRIGERVVLEPVLRRMHGRALDPSWYLGSECDGGFAEYVRIPAENAHPVHRGLSDVEWASFPCSFSTAEHLLARSELAAGEDVLITGASGGVGSAAVQLAKARGAAVTAVCGAAKAAAVAALGADRTVHRDDPLGRAAYDVVVDLVGGPRWPDHLAALRRHGRYATAGAIAGAHVELDLRTLYLHDLTLIGATLYDETVFPALLRRIESGAVDPVVAATFPLSEMPQAQEAFARHRHVGKIVLTVPE
jgi:NADPH:quinone reductase-like Zn-dependent oxidoreductase